MSPPPISIHKRRDQILELFRACATENRAVLVVTHDPKVRNVVDRVLTIRDGLLGN